jgi:hypothetical protein
VTLPEPLVELIEDLRKWRDTELAAQQDVEDAEHHANNARAALKHVQDELKAAADAVDDAIIDYTMPTEIIFTPEGDD